MNDEELQVKPTGLWKYIVNWNRALGPAPLGWHMVTEEHPCLQRGRPHNCETLRGEARMLANTLLEVHPVTKDPLAVRRFYLMRLEDESGQSGIGRVAEGAQHSNGKCVLFWNVRPYAMGIYASVADVEAIHGHGGKTTLLWLD